MTTLKTILSAILGLTSIMLGYLAFSLFYCLAAAILFFLMHAMSLT